MSLLEVRGLGKRYVSRRNVFGRPEAFVDAVRDVSFSVEEGQTLALVGESGAGKSTTGRLVLRLIEPDRGTIMFDGMDVGALSSKELRRSRAKMQMIFQDPYSSLDPRVPVVESVAEALLVHYRTPRDERTRRAHELLDRVGIPGGSHVSYPAELSGGQLQRVAIARAVSLNPKLIVCDEPVAALDVSVRAQVLNLMKDLQVEHGLSYLFITHDLSLVEVIADAIVVMRDGEIVEQGTTRSVFDAPQEDYTRELLSAILPPIPKALRQPAATTVAGAESGA